jgi:hypothetical protein
MNPAAVLFRSIPEELPVSTTAVPTTTAVESTPTTAAVEAATTAAMESTSAATTMEAAAAHVTTVAAAITVTRSSIAITGTSVPIAVAAAIAVHAAVSISVAAIPGAGPDKDAAVEPRRSVVPVGRASVGIVSVVAIGADRSRIAIAPIDRATNSNANRDLGMRISRGGEQQDTEYSEIA